MDLMNYLMQQQMNQNPPQMENPALMNYRQQAQQMQQQNVQSEHAGGQMSNPLQMGAQLAMKTARHSAGLPDERQQAKEQFGRGMIAFGQAMSHPYRDKFSAMNQALGHGINASLQQRDMHDQMNAQMYAEAIRQKEQEREFERKIQEDHRKVEEAELDRALRREQLAQQMTMHEQEVGEQRRAHDMMNNYRSHSLGMKHGNETSIEREGAIKGLYGVEYIPVDPKDNDWKKIVNKEKSSLVPNKRAIESIKGMKEIFNKYPDIGSSFLNIIEEDQKGGPSWMTQLMRKAANEEERSAIHLLKKLSADIQLDTVMGMPGQKGTDIMKRAVQAASPTGILTKKAFDDVSNIWLKRADENIKKIKIMEDAQKRGMMPLFSTMEEEIESYQGSSDLSHMSDEELERIASQ